MSGGMEDMDYEHRMQFMQQTAPHAKHYQMMKPEPIEVIENWGLGFHLGNAVKYIARAPYKGSKKQDLEKAIWYLQRELNKL